MEQDEGKVVENQDATGATVATRNGATAEINGATQAPAGPSVNVPTVSVNVGEQKPPEPKVYQPRNKRVAFQVIDFIFWIGSALVLLRFALKLAAANPLNGFVSFVYGLTEKSVGVFADIFGTTPEGSPRALIELTTGNAPNNAIELSALMAWLVLWILYMIVKKILTIATTPK